MQSKRIVLVFLALLLTVGALLALGREESPQNILPTEGLLLCEIEGEPYYYDHEYLFKITAAVFPEEPTSQDKKHAVFYELAYREMVAADAYVSIDRLEQEIKERRTIENAAEESLADPDADGSLQIFYEEYLSMLNACAEKEGTTTRVFWDDISPYVEKGILIEMYGGEKLDAFWKTNRTPDEYEDQILSDYDSLTEKYDVIFCE